MNRLFFFVSSTIGLVFFSAILFAPVTHAQNAEQFLIPSGKPLILNLTPELPRPGQNVSARVESLSIDLNRATISWTVNGKSVSRAVGQKEITFTAGGVGSVTTVKVTAILGNITASESITIRPADVDLVWEAKTFTPPFYKGKALYPAQGDVVITALPNFSQGVNPKNLIYTWKKDGEVIGKSSGYGRQSITLSGSVISRPLNVSVTVSTTDGRTNGTGKIVLAPQNPKVIFYEDNPLTGVQYQTALNGEFTLRNDEIKLLAMPYFYSAITSHDGNNQNYKWKINNRTVDAVNDGSNSIVLRKPQTASGQSAISVQVNNLSRILQLGDGSTIINFSTTQ